MYVRRFLASLFVAVAASQLSGTAHPTSVPLPSNPGCVQDFPSAASPDPSATVVMCGLENPRGLTFNESALYVAEAGRGALGLPFDPSVCFTSQVGGTRCYAPTGALSRLWNGVQERIAEGFPSHAPLNGFIAIGPSDVVFVPTGLPPALDRAPESPACGSGCLYVSVGLQQPPSFRTQFPFLADFAKIARVGPAGDWSYIADIGAHELQHDPDQVFLPTPHVDTNPNALLSEPVGRSLIVVDAGGNTLLRRSGAPADLPPFDTSAISTIAVFGPHPPDRDAVPTSVEIGPDGAYYVGELSGFPLIPGNANVFRVPRSGQTPEVCLAGFTAIIDLVFDSTDRMYVLQHSGELIRVTLDSALSPPANPAADLCARYAAGTRVAIVTGLTNPTSIVIGPDGALYISNRGVNPGRGQVIRFER